MEFSLYFPTRGAHSWSITDNGAHLRRSAGVTTPGGCEKARLNYVDSLSSPTSLATGARAPVTPTVEGESGALAAQGEHSP